MATPMGDGDPPRFAHSWNEHKGPNAAAFKHGPYTADEDERIKAAFNEFCSLHGLDAEGRTALIVQGARAAQLPDCWKFVAEGFQFRTLRSVRQRGERLLHPGCGRGGLTAEEQTMLSHLLATLGPKWHDIGKLMNRYPQDLMSMHARGGPALGGDRAPSMWSSAEEDALVALVRKHGRRVEGGGFTSIPWVLVAEQLGSRNSAACKLKWDSGLGTARCGLVWDAAADAALVRGVAADGGERSEDVKWWSVLPGRPGPECRERFSTLRRELPQHGGALSFGDAVDALLSAAGIDQDAAASPAPSAAQPPPSKRGRGGEPAAGAAAVTTDASGSGRGASEAANSDDERAEQRARKRARKEERRAKRRRAEEGRAASPAGQPVSKRSGSSSGALQHEEDGAAGEQRDGGDAEAADAALTAERRRAAKRRVT